MKVIYMYHRENDDFYAVFPEHKEGGSGFLNSKFLCYSHTGQHSSATMGYIRDSEVLVKGELVKNMKKELISIGYELNNVFDSSKYVYVQETNTIGIIIDQGIGLGFYPWYRTDCDGIRDPMELLFLQTKKDVLRCTKQFNAFIPDSTRKLIGL